eukprot:Pgem_evm1s2516
MRTRMCNGFLYIAIKRDNRIVGINYTSSEFGFRFTDFTAFNVNVTKNQGGQSSQCCK